MARTATKMRRDDRHLTRKSSVGAVFRQFVVGSNDMLLRMEIDAARMDEPAIHHFRTAIRRLRSILTTFKPMLPAGPRKEFADRLKYASQRYAALRELDVILEALKKPLAEDKPRHAAFLQADEAVRADRQAQRSQHPALAEDIAAIDRVLASADWLREPVPEGDKVWRRRLDEYAPKLLEKQRRRLRKEAMLLDLNDPSAFHKFRIDTKKHRYLIEFSAFLYKKKKVRAYLDRLIEIQDILGEMHDAETARAIMARLDLSDEARAAVANWLEQRLTECRAHYPVGAEAFRGMKPFWN